MPRVFVSRNRDRMEVAVNSHASPFEGRMAACKMRGGPVFHRPCTLQFFRRRVSSPRPCSVSCSFLVLWLASASPSGFRGPQPATDSCAAQGPPALRLRGAAAGWNDPKHGASSDRDSSAELCGGRSIREALQCKIESLPPSVRPAPVGHVSGWQERRRLPLTLLLVLWDHALSLGLGFYQSNSTGQSPCDLDEQLQKVQALSDRMDSLFGETAWARLQRCSGDDGMAKGQQDPHASDHPRMELFSQLWSAAADPSIESIDEKLSAAQEADSGDLLQRLQCALNLASQFKAAATEARAAQPSPNQVRFWKAVDEGEEVEAVRLVGSGHVDLDMVDPSHWSNVRAAHRAARRGHARLLVALVRRGADLRLTDKHGETALHAAARAHQLEVLAVLCSRFGLPVNDANCWGECGGGRKGGRGETRRVDVFGDGAGEREREGARRDGYLRGATRGIRSLLWVI